MHKGCGCCRECQPAVPLHTTRCNSGQAWWHLQPRLVGTLWMLHVLQPGLCLCACLTRVVVLPLPHLRTPLQVLRPVCQDDGGQGAEDEALALLAVRGSDGRTVIVIASGRAAAQGACMGGWDGGSVAWVGRVDWPCPSRVRAGGWVRGWPRRSRCGPTTLYLFSSGKRVQAPFAPVLFISSVEVCWPEVVVSAGGMVCRCRWVLEGRHKG